MWDLISGAQLDEYLDQGKRLFLVDILLQLLMDKLLLQELKK